MPPAITGDAVMIAAGWASTCVCHSFRPLRLLTAMTAAPVWDVLVSPITISSPETAGLVRERSPAIPV